MKINSKLLLLTGADKTTLLGMLKEKGQEIVAVFVPASDKYRSKYEPLIEFCSEHKIILICGKPSELYNKIKSLNFDVVYSCGYPFKILGDLISRVKYAINFHSSLLPKHRGRYVHWAILDGDEEAGITAHLMDDKYDTGPVIGQMNHPVSIFETESLLRKDAELERLLDQVNRGNELRAVVQDEENATEHFVKRDPVDSKIGPSKTFLELYNEIRVCHPSLYPAYFELEGQKSRN